MPQHRKVRLGVLGCARVARRRFLPALAAASGLELTAVASRDPARAAEFAAEFGGEAVAGYRNLLDRDDVDAVYLPLPTGLHFDWARQALTAGKHVLAEKPLTAGLGETEELVELARRTGLLLRENLMFLHHRQHTAVRELVASGEIGDLRSISAVFGHPPLPAGDVRYRTDLGGGSLLDVGVYPIRLAQFFDAGLWQVAGAVLRRDPRGADVAGSALLRSAAEHTAQLEFGFEHHYRNVYRLWGTEGLVTVRHAFTPGADKPPSVTVERPDRTVELDLPADDQFRNAAEAFARDVLAGAGVDETGDAEAILRQARLVDAVREAAAAPHRGARSGRGDGATLAR
ncbi:Gfo/Idh/MocA family protein [Amycolatopsis circi]|uniref:Gfo/Idh/MocA family protein n=1 Tax=Amycolatopsis circi TaxID=871959 RepID=UPI001AC00AD2|nr:Gfo/Idh/MocA family oxidoreductase [Amycolatopsis circi]